MGKITILTCLWVIIFKGCHQRETQNYEIVEVVGVVADSEQLESPPKSNPCDNFFEYVCENWDEDNATETDFGYGGLLSVRANNNMQELQTFLNGPNANDEPDSVHKARKLYSLCTSTEKFDRKRTVGAGPTLKRILSKVGLSADPPALRLSTLDLFSTLIKIQKYVGISPFFRISVSPDPYDKTTNLPTITTNGPELNSLFPIKNQQIMKLAAFSTGTEFLHGVIVTICGSTNSGICNYLRTLTDGLGATLVYIPLTEYLKASYELYMKTDLTSVPKVYTLEELQKITDDIADTARSGPPYMSILNVSENEQPTPMENQIAKIDWVQFFSTFFSNVEAFPIDKNVKVVVRDMESLNATFHYIYSRSGLDIINRKASIEFGLWWEVVHHLILSSGIHARENYCANIVSKHLGNALNYYYTKNSTYDDIRKEVNEMIGNASGEKFINRFSWMDYKTKAEALKKMESLKIVLAYTENLEESKRQFNITDDLLETLTNSNENLFSAILDLVTAVNNPKVQKDKFLSASVNLINDFESNKLIIPAGILGMWDTKNSSKKAFTYGSLGTVIMSQLFHSFDYAGRQYNSKGTIEDWWGPDTVKEYEKQLSCLKENHYKMNRPLNCPTCETEEITTRVLKEVMAVVTGFKQSLQLFRNDLKKEGEESAVPEGSNFTNEQLFTLAFANTWCKNHLYTRSTYSMLVNTVATQSQEFANIWKCQKGTLMNPDNERCSLLK